MTDLSLSREAFARHADADGPVVIRAAADVDAEASPLDAYAALTGRTTDVDRSPYTFLLESAEKTASSDPAGAFAPASAAESAERHARYSFVGYDPAAVVTVSPDETRVEAMDERYADLVNVGRGDGGERGRGERGPRRETERTDGDDVLDVLRRAMPDVERAGFPPSERQQLDGGLVGFLAYDAVYDLWLDEQGVDRPDSPLPDAQFALTTRTLTFDEVSGTVSLVFTPVLRPGDDPDERHDELLAETERVESLLEDAGELRTGGFERDGETAGPREEYEDAVERAKEHVLDGDIYQGVVSRTREIEGEVDPLGLYESLRAVNPSPYMYLLDYDERSVVGASPETLVSVRGREVTSNPIAGTCERGDSPVEDRRLAGEMLADDKERAEHTMLVDLARNDVRRVSEAGSVRVEEFMNVLKYSHVQHIESTVTGRLADGTDAAGGTSASRKTESFDAFDATRAAFPAGTLSGAPKIRAMEIIDGLERGPRGLYGGGVGYYSWTGDADFAIVIRTATVDSADERDRITVRAGAGIVADSDPAAEYEETEKKMGGVLAALERIERDRPEAVPR